jgi:DNA-binding NtrC family response regulator
MQHSEKLLIVDDDKSILDILELSLNCLAYENVSRAQSAAKALTLIDESEQPFGNPPEKWLC